MEEQGLMITNENEIGRTNVAPPVKEKKSSLPIFLAIIMLLLVIGMIVLMILADSETSGLIRDIFFVVFVLQSVFIAIALTVLITQFSALINLLQNESKPLMKNANDTVRDIKGTVKFLNENIVEPAIKANSTMAGFARIFSMFTSAFKK